MAASSDGISRKSIDWRITRIEDFKPFLSEKEREDVKRIVQNMDINGSWFGIPGYAYDRLACHWEMVNIALKLIIHYGNLTEVRCHNKSGPGGIELIYEDGYTLMVPDRSPPNIDIGLISFGYSGTRSQCFCAFLKASGFDITLEQVENLKPGSTLHPKDDVKSYLFCKPEIGSLETGETRKEKRFVDNTDGSMTDITTGLVWQKEDDGKPRNYEQSIKYCEGLDLGGHHDWRLPRKDELMKLAGVGYDSLKEVFPNIKAEIYWAMTDMNEISWAERAAKGMADKIAYAVDFDPRSSNYGSHATYFKNYQYYVRAVRKL